MNAAKKKFSGGYAGVRQGIHT